MKIGTAVPDRRTIEAVPHHFIGSHSIHDYYNASKFEFEVLERIEDLFQKMDIILMTGGSMMYIDAICKGIDDLPEVDLALRQSLVKRFQTEGIENLQNELRELDPVYYAEVDLKNPKRILHALEICMMTSLPFSSFRMNQQKKRPFNIIKIGLNCDRNDLYGRINRRVDVMIAEGLEKEAISLYPFRHLNSLNTVGYRELFDFIDGKVTIQQAIEKIKANSRRYARKQLTWFRQDPEINWFSPDNKDEIIAFVNNLIYN